ncbi:unnamed protein product [Trichogramma brassicae]|uniref:Uncharacterized protein n=1 Tax=Trichogramma brassicae TaxID=86971 RepID=A0A6H5I4M9_9HYME|nr:unnamed protein product [Trichogramma brassicae]
MRCRKNQSRRTHTCNVHTLTHSHRRGAPGLTYIYTRERKRKRSEASIYSSTRGAAAPPQVSRLYTQYACTTPREEDALLGRSGQWMRERLCIVDTSLAALHRITVCVCVVHSLRPRSIGPITV